MEIIVNKKKIKLVIANTFFKRLKGFMFKKNINYCMRFKTNSIHTFFMKDEIDILMTDRNNKILYIFKNVKKNKIIIQRNVYFTYEFPSNFLENVDIKDTLIIKN